MTNPNIAGNPEPSVDDYQLATRQTAVYTGSGDHSLEALSYVLMALGGEVGSVQNKFKKILRGDYHGLGDSGEYKVRPDSDLRPHAIPQDHALQDALHDLDAEVGDILWYLMRYCEERGLWMGDVLRANYDKLNSRAQRGVIKGKGSHR